MYIYKLIDPLTSEPFYVGKSKNVTSRLAYHLREASTKGLSDLPRCRYINDLRRRGLKPIIAVIEEVRVESADARERFWIAALIASGFKLTNVSLVPPSTIKTLKLSAPMKKLIVRVYQVPNHRIRAGYGTLWGKDEVYIPTVTALIDRNILKRISVDLFELTDIGRDIGELLTHG